MLPHLPDIESRLARANGLSRRWQAELYIAALVDEGPTALLASAQGLFTDQAKKVPVGNLNRRLEYEDAFDFRLFRYELSANGIDIWIQQVAGRKVCHLHSVSDAGNAKDSGKNPALVCIGAVRNFAAEICVQLSPAGV